MTKKKTHKRLPDDQAKERDEFALKLWMDNPKMSVPKANVAIAKKFGAEIRTQNAYKLRRIARTMLEDQKRTATTGAAAALQAAARDPGIVHEALAGARMAGQPVIIKLSGRQHAGAVQDALAQLAAQGVKVSVPFVADTYLVAEIAK